jgi:integrase
VPSLVIARGGKFGARARTGRGGRLVWLGTFESETLAREAVRRAHERRARPSRRNRDVIPPTEAQVLALAGDGPLWVRGMIIVAAFTGLRLFEVAALEACDVIAPAEGNAWRVRVRAGKGGYRDEVSAVFGPAIEVLSTLATTRPAGRLFVNERGRPVTRQTLARQFGERARAVGFVGTFHALRHFHACWLIDQGGSDLDVSIQLRHHDNGEEVRRRYGRHRKATEALRRLDGLG